MSDAAATSPPVEIHSVAPWRRGLQLVAVLLSLAGAYMSWELLRYSAGASNSPLLQLACGGGSSGGCSAVLRSSAAFIPRRDAAGNQRPGVPWAAAGIAYFGALLMWNTLVGPVTRSRWYWHLVPLVLVVGGIGVSTLLLGWMTGSLGQWCWGCAAVHTLNGCLALAVLLITPWHAGAPLHRPHPSTALGFSAVLAITFFAILATYFPVLVRSANEATQVAQRYERLMKDPSFVRWSVDRQMPKTLVLREDEHWIGDPSAANTVVLFTDLQCARCAQAYEMLTRLAEQNPKALRVASRHFPLSTACNPAAKGSGHEAACEAALAVEAARVVAGPERAEQLKRSLYANQRGLNSTRIAQQVEAAGIDVAAWRTALEEPWVKAALERDVSEGGALNVSVAPTIYLNGRWVEYWISEPAWREMLGLTAASQPGGQ